LIEAFVVLTALSFWHHDEQKRIRNLGGFVSPNGRVVGMLAVSRAFGDLDLQPFISADPYVDVIDIADPPDFLILVMPPPLPSLQHPLFPSSTNRGLIITHSQRRRVTACGM
jgi:hypothetical protein